MGGTVMFGSFKRSWRQLKSGAPGRRFQSQYAAQQQSRRPSWMRPLWIAVGTSLVAAGIVALPGPGILVVALGTLLIARESRVGARLLDWTELRLHEAAAWAKNAWAMAPWPVKLLTILFGMAIAVAFGWLAAVYVLGHFVR